MPDSLRIKLAPSILSADFARLGEEVGEVVAAGVDYIHLDVMDGQFVPPITFGARMVEAIKPHARGVPLDVHLMIQEPLKLVPDFASAGADIIVVHAEACSHLLRTIAAIKEKGIKAGAAINPGSPLALIEEVLEDIDLALVMTVNPGWGGQPYLSSMERKVARLRSMLDERGLNAELEVDGGINETTAVRAVRAGARVLVAGSAVYGRKESVKERVAVIRAAADSASSKGTERGPSRG